MNSTWKDIMKQSMNHRHIQYTMISDLSYIYSRNSSHNIMNILNYFHLDQLVMKIVIKLNKLSEIKMEMKLI